MRHSDILAIGYSCTECHNTAGHGIQVLRPRYPVMAQCIQCHDGQKARSECVTCHTQDVGVAARQLSSGFTKALITVDGCRGCHAMNTCINCHGIELPHSDQFKAGFHARKALLQPTLCQKCHDTKAFCNRCHVFLIGKNGLELNPHANQGNFVTWHRSAGGPGMGSCSCHTQGAPRQTFCNNCHAPQPSR